MALAAIRGTCVSLRHIFADEIPMTQRRRNRTSDHGEEKEEDKADEGEGGRRVGGVGGRYARGDCPVEG